MNELIVVEKIEGWEKRREALHCGLDKNIFESAARCWFDIRESREVSPTRHVYLLQKA
jgi:hypothetical protein